MADADPGLTHRLTHRPVILYAEGVAMGFSEQDLLEQHGSLVNLDRIRFGPRFQPRERLNVPYQGVRPELPEKPKRTKAEKRQKPPPEPGLEQHQLRLW